MIVSDRSAALATGRLRTHLDHQPQAGDTAEPDGIQGRNEQHPCRRSRCCRALRLGRRQRSAGLDARRKLSHRPPIRMLLDVGTRRSQRLARRRSVLRRLPTKRESPVHPYTATAGSKRCAEPAHPSHRQRHFRRAAWRAARRLRRRDLVLSAGMAGATRILLPRTGLGSRSDRPALGCFSQPG